MQSGSILIVDDETSLLEFLSVLCSGEGLSVTTARSVREAREQLAERTPDLVLCDMMMPDGNGLELLREIKGGDSRTSVVMMTAYTSTKNAIDAMKLGAYDYVSKPFDIDELKAVLERALEKNRLYEENTYLRRELEQRYAFKNIIGRSPKMQAIFGLIERVARTASTVLIHGESGTGKELIARAIHFSSPRAAQRVLSINCGAMPENLLESELFGHERGAFTGAVRDKKGLFQEANHGTLFLDEIGEMSLPMQVKLLRVLQEKVVRRVGGATEDPVDVRIIAATNQNLVDNMHSKYRRGRSAATNLVITETGAGSAIDKAIPGLGPKFTSNAIRVPVPDGSLAILNLQVSKHTTLDGINEIMRKAALEGDLVEQINYSISNELVSSDIIGNSCPAIYDSKATQVHPDGMSVVLYVWYDNEYGYSCRVADLVTRIA